MLVLALICAVMLQGVCVWGAANESNGKLASGRDRSAHFVGNVNGDLVISPATGRSVIVDGINVTERLNSVDNSLTDLGAETEQLRAMLEHLWGWSRQKASGNDLCALSADVVQEIPTVGSMDWVYFKLGDVAHLAVANYRDGSNYRVDSVVYRRDGTRFVSIQEIPTIGARDWEYFELDGVAHLAVANYYDGNIYRVNSVIYRHDGNQFMPVQEIPTAGALKWKYFEIAGAPHLVVANHWDGTNTVVQSIVYRHDGNKFVPTNMLPNLVGRAYDWEYFEIDGKAHLVVANFKVRDEYRQNSIIYRYDGTRFVTIQEIPTIGAMDWEYFQLDGAAHLAVANYRKGSDIRQISVIYRYDGNKFVSIQEIPTNAANQWKYFELDGMAHLSLAVTATRSDSDGSSIYRANSIIYRYNGTRFVSVLEIPTIGAFDLEYFQLDGATHLAVANHRDNPDTYRLSSVLYRLQAPPVTDLCP